jgi:hypothetical protein
LNKLVYFSLTLLAGIAGIILGILCTLHFAPYKTVQVPVPIVRTIEKKDTISITQFKVKSKTDTIYMSRPLIWKEYSYDDSMLSIRFEADTFRNFSYSLHSKEYILPTIAGQKQNYGDIFLATDLKAIYCGMSYKFLKVGIKYDVRSKSYSPFIGVRLQF